MYIEKKRIAQFCFKYFNKHSFDARLQEKWITVFNTFNIGFLCIIVVS